MKYTSEDLDRLRSVRITAQATPSRNPRAVETENLQRRWDKDIPAYRRLVKDGLNPRSTDGSARLEATANTREEIE